jgi:hypothetical protein
MRWLAHVLESPKATTRPPPNGRAITAGRLEGVESSSVSTTVAQPWPPESEAAAST